ncbi:SAM-dependent methyltransferase [Methylobacterium isbiliense]|uniref:Cyclopropane-fatty-acyl-phospholipid synthase n=1 Tax=Methylobacterium isbiliense TaxID=315478 RepID=A0ABQ4SEC8_9HYPH|nr:cyclopropane-fatty-acyl-phospholipid synthase family protein [Methylobacterium isbiliense]MDN3622399.1 cyclopropane-fatty-acyl-phospholipid synthase family protein [Methylobacterium isbiliense]GJE01571.1 Cyclopropane-fatty-acyl-phospholipid synthase [Methylobacterium isbiliense]
MRSLPLTALVGRVFDRQLRAVPLAGRLTIVAADGRRYTAGDGGGPQVTLRLRDGAAACALLLDPELKLGELYTEGRIVLEGGTLPDLLTVLLARSHGVAPVAALPVMAALRALVRRLGLGNTPARARRNVSHHYEYDERLYALFLDEAWQYSCAYYEAEGDDLATAQQAKMRHIAAKLLAGPGQRVLDIGCGWGGLALYLALAAGCDDVRGITLSGRQLARARAEAAARGLAGRVRFALEDFRSTRGTFDRIVSVGMFEHVGRPDYATFFDLARARLAEDGVMLLHTIGRTGAPYPTNPWITRYIFPGGHLPTLSEMMPAIERSGLIVTDIEVLRLHYARTLAAWRARFLARHEAARGLYGERFCRMWDWYLASCEAAFRYEDVVVFQVQLARRNDAVPLTRGYIVQAEARLAAREAALTGRPAMTDA